MPARWVKTTALREISRFMRCLQCKASQLSTPELVQQYLRHALGVQFTTGNTEAPAFRGLLQELEGVVAPEPVVYAAAPGPDDRSQPFVDERG